MKRGQVRIIGGQWRGRKLNFPAVPGVRPTPNRVRETLFNWLDPRLAGAHCLDLFAGSGALGFEALSRRAKSVTFVERSSLLVHYLKSEIERFAIQDKARVFHANFPFQADSLFPAPKPSFDIVFLDPPFHEDLITAVCDWLIKENLLLPKSTIYIEMKASLKAPSLPESWQIHRWERAGQVNYGLIKTST